MRSPHRTFALTPAWRDYVGPEELAVFADALPAIGEFIVSFSMVEARMRWCKEALLGTSLDEAYSLEGFVQNFSARCKFLEVIGLPIARSTGSEKLFVLIISRLFQANSFRNRLVHNKFSGIAVLSSGVSVKKEKFAEKLEKRSYTISVDSMRLQSSSNIDLCREIQRWTLDVRPHAENRMP